MELHEFHIHQLGACVVRQRVAVPGVFPTVARDRIGASDATGRENDGLRAEQLETAPLALVAKRPGDAAIVEQERDHRAFHMHVDAAMNPMILKRSNHLESGPVAHVRETRILVAAEIALQNPSVLRPIEPRPPGFQLSYALRRFPGMQLRHSPIVDVLPAAHRVGEMYLPVVAVVHIGERGGDPAFRHYRMGFAKQRLANQTHRDSLSCRFNRRAEPGASCTDHKHIVFVGGVFHS
jgi:hypothetical protein